MGGIGGALLGSRRIVAKDGTTELSAGLILPEGRAEAAQTQDAANGRGCEDFEDLAA
jgi:hypothetical protein